MPAGQPWTEREPAELTASAQPETCRFPLSHRVADQHGRLAEARNVERAGGVGAMMLDEVDRAVPLQAVAQQRRRLTRRPSRHARPTLHGLPLLARELLAWHFIESQPTSIGDRRVSAIKAIPDRAHGQRGVVLAAGETLLLRGGNNAFIAHQACRRIMRQCRDP